MNLRTFVIISSYICLIHSFRQAPRGGMTRSCCKELKKHIPRVVYNYLPTIFFFSSFFFLFTYFLFQFLAHLSRRLIGELIVYPWSGIRRPSSTMLKHLLLRNRWADQSQILCGASLGRGNDILFAASGSHDQDGCHTHIW